MLDEGVQCGMKEGIQGCGLGDPHGVARADSRRVEDALTFIRLGHGGRGLAVAVQTGRSPELVLQHVGNHTKAENIFPCLDAQCQNRRMLSKTDFLLSRFISAHQRPSLHGGPQVTNSRAKARKEDTKPRHGSRFQQVLNLPVC